MVNISAPVYGPATTTTLGVVKKAAAVADSALGSVAPTPTAPAGVDTINRATLNTNLDTSFAAVNSMILELEGKLNAALAALRAAGLMEP